ncbi:ComEC/Rec2 family competence protein [Sulfurimonas microaerophilic]|uniref:ComEC/Rec2 family competence protein n=1 Tax=Sulfurimonas microaerophilic TaxID=3058392 RepID=UPI00271463BD|nr:ComEC/Rec2 family competence protein [Sulfurimonas sp. hsl 1-7]
MIEKVELLQTKKEWLSLFLLFFLLLTLNLSYEYYKYKQLIKFDSALVEATVLKQYDKTKLTKTGKTKHYQVLKLKASEGYTFYTVAKKELPDISSKKIRLEIFTGEIGNISFTEYIKGFFAFSKILNIDDSTTTKEKLSRFIEKQHQSPEITALYKALYLAKSLPSELQTTFSTLGLSHLIAISGFHLGVLSALLYFLLKYPYRVFHNNYFPYRSYKIDSFFIIATALLLYTLFLESPPSLLRAFVMLVIGFFLYDRGIKIISMQTLLFTVLLILAFFPRLFFNIGLWLSVAGVFYIFLFLIYFQKLGKVYQFLLLPLFVYLMMLPYSLSFFGNFSYIHPLSIIHTTLFTLFYPFSLVLHIVGLGSLFDPLLVMLLKSADFGTVVILDQKILWLFIGVSLGSIYNRVLFYILNIFALSIFIYAVYNVT